MLDDMKTNFSNEGETLRKTHIFIYGFWTQNCTNIMFKVLLILFFKFNSLIYCFVIIIAGRKAEMQEEAVWHCLSRQVGMGHPRSNSLGSSCSRHTYTELSVCIYTENSNGIGAFLALKIHRSKVQEETVWHCLSRQVGMGHQAAGKYRVIHMFSDWK